MILAWLNLKNNYYKFNTNSTMTTVFDSTQNIKALAESTQYERIGSLIYWSFPDKNGFKHDLGEIKCIFDGTLASQHLSEVGFAECIRRFATSVSCQHGNLYGKQLKYLIEKDKSNSGYFYVSFYTGKVDDKTNTNFTEHAKIWMGEDGQNVALLDKDDQFLVQSWDELHHEFNQHWKITNKDIASSLGKLANSIGYRFTPHGGYYFIPHKYTDEMYKLKTILSKHGQTFSITPLIAGCEDDIEEIVNILGADFKKELELAEKELFEQCVHVYGYLAHWEEYVRLAGDRSIDALQQNKISKTQYGRKLTEKMLKVDANASETEYQVIIKEYLSGIQPNKQKSVAKIYAIQDRLQRAIEKLDTAIGANLMQSWRDRILSNLNQINASLQKTSALLLDEVLSVL